MENLRNYISSKDSTLPWFLGRHFKKNYANVDHYLTGGPGFSISNLIYLNHFSTSECLGYLLTRKTLQLLVEQGLNKNQCEMSLTGNMDDLIIGNKKIRNSLPYML
jgi:hypothetical protein